MSLITHVQYRDITPDAIKLKNHNMTLNSEDMCAVFLTENKTSEGFLSVQIST